MLIFRFKNISFYSPPLHPLEHLIKTRKLFYHTLLFKKVDTRFQKLLNIIFALVFRRLFPREKWRKMSLTLPPLPFGDAPQNCPNFDEKSTPFRPKFYCSNNPRSRKPHSLIKRRSTPQPGPSVHLRLQFIIYTTRARLDFYLDLFY